MDILFSDGTKVALLCKGIEADLNIGIKTQGKLQALKVEKPLEYAVTATSWRAATVLPSGATVQTEYRHIRLTRRKPRRP